MSTPRDAAASVRTDRFFSYWLGWVSLGEFAGFLVPMAAESLIITAGLDDLPGAGLLVVSGLGEGAVLGAAMSWRFSRRLPALNRRRFALLSALGGAMAWALGMMPVVTVEAWAGWPVPLVVIAGIVLGIALLASIGVLQWIELRRHLVAAWAWVLATAAAWCAGLGAFFAIAPPLWNEGQTLPLVLAIGALGAAAMAITMAAITGWAAVALLRRTRANTVSGAW
ncbi:hypothetical protein GCM10027449_19180 [Sinomonas notoginsengisoli]|uniref:hypothetical protein n=1 Tax=Sinomonas notoginsengisoli TaxID=1457311 RepID=UPI001F44BD5B|nr:hypothetical protein [Sinomonas notoginsengisoli]